MPQTEISPVTDAEGQVLGISKIARDVSQRRQVEHERDRLLLRLLDALDQLKTLRGMLLAGFWCYCRVGFRRTHVLRAQGVGHLHCEMGLQIAFDGFPGVVRIPDVFTLGAHWNELADPLQRGLEALDLVHEPFERREIDDDEIRLCRQHRVQGLVTRTDMNLMALPFQQGTHQVTGVLSHDGKPSASALSFE
jgi:hypothetical protein